MDVPWLLVVVLILGGQIKSAEEAVFHPRNSNTYKSVRQPTYTKNNIK